MQQIKFFNSIPLSKFIRERVYPREIRNGTDSHNAHNAVGESLEVLLVKRAVPTVIQEAVRLREFHSLLVRISHRDFVPHGGFRQ